MLITFLCEPAKTVPKMNSLILILFLGATVALAEIHVENDPPHKAPRPILVSFNSLLYIYVSSSICVTNFKENSTINSVIYPLLFLSFSMNILVVSIEFIDGCSLLKEP